MVQHKALWLLGLSLSLFARDTRTQTSAPMPPDYRGVSERIEGIFVTPITGSPFTATVSILSYQKLPNGTERTVKTINHIARSSSGRIRNERRLLIPPNFQGEPRLLSAHFYDPNTRENIFTDEPTRIARMTILPEKHPLSTAVPVNGPRTSADATDSSLGEQTFENLRLIGTRKTRIIPAERSGTSEPVTVTDDYWYSADLRIYLIIQHNDPRSGEQIVAVSDIQRSEPDANLLRVPDGYKLVDETPPTASHP